MNVLWIAIQEGGQAAEPGLFDLNLGVSAWTVVIFLVLLWVLKRWAFPPILGYAEAREQRIQEILDAAADDRAEAERLLEEQRRELAEARSHAQEIVADGKEAGERVREDVIARAREEQKELLEEARRDIGREREKALEAIRREAVELSIAAAGKLVEQRLGADEDRRLVTRYLDEVEVSENGGETGGAF